MQTWECIQDSINYIEKNYERPLSLEELASISYLSPFYYQRLFKKLVGKTVNEYITLRRLAHAINLIQTTDASLLTIALSCGFKSDSTFTKVFKKTYTITPGTLRKDNLTLDVFPQPNLQLNYTYIDLGVPLITNNMFLEINRTTLNKNTLFIGKSKLSKSEEIAQPKINDLQSLWGEVVNDPHILANKTDDYFYDVLSYSDNPNFFNYFVGSPSKAPLKDYEEWIMPQGNYYVCSYEAENFNHLVNESLYIASKYFFDVWLPLHKIVPDSFLVQKYSDPSLPTPFIELWVKESKQSD